MVDEQGQPAAPGQEGDLQSRGPGLFAGYYKRPDLYRSGTSFGLAWGEPDHPERQAAAVHPFIRRFSGSRSGVLPTTATLTG